MKISILCTDPRHPVNAWIEAWAAAVSSRADVRILRDYRELQGGDYLFLVSCHQIIRKPTRDLFRHTLVLHASPLPQGRGMSPHIWAILEGQTELTLTLLEAADDLDSGAIWHQIRFEVPATALVDEIHQRLFEAEIAMLDWALDNLHTAQPRPQTGEPSYYRKRTPADSEIDPDRPLRESFDLLRVADPDRYPAFFSFRGQTYRIKIEKA